MNNGASSRDRAHMRRKLLAWYDRNRRDLPWRRTKDPYRVWLSEMMLQQTQVATVIPYYQRFTAAFPDVRALAAAPLENVLKLWAGLGYYARARHMHAAARAVVAEFGGDFPASVEELRRLPGIGPYSAAAVASIAFGVQAAVVDGNVARVLARLHAVREDVSTAKGKALIQRRADELIPPRRCGDFNQALMELGATVCLPGAAARCPQCPLRTHCSALAAGLVEKLPRKRARTTVSTETHAVAAIHRAGRWLVVQRDQRGLWGGLWELPTAVVNGATPRAAAAGLVERFVGAAPRSAKAFCDLERLLSHRRIRFVGFRFDLEHRPGGAQTSPARKKGKEKARWLTLGQLRAVGISNAMKVVLSALAAADAASRGGRRRRSARRAGPAACATSR